ncbi:aldo/keto reductase [Akkermansiaceae bacterium]|nr:aldo/keto reductase [Akkermansiaceae bacterium]
MLKNSDAMMRYWYGLGEELPAVGFGCWQISGNHEVSGRPNGWGDISDSNAKQLIWYALDAGIRFFDTAQGYGNGRSEKLLGEAIAEHPRGGQAVICTKIPNPSHKSRLHYAKKIDEAVEVSLQRLGRDYVDIVLLHNPPDEYQYDDVCIDAFEAQRRKGNIKTYGVSARTLIGANSALLSGFGTCVEWNFNLFERRPITDIFPLCRAHQINFIGRSPLARGLITDRFLQAKKPYFNDSEFRSTLDPTWVEWVKLELIRFKKDCKIKPKISDYALRYLMSFDDASVIIPGVNSVAHIESIKQLKIEGKLDEKTLLDLEHYLPVCYPGYR